MGRVIDVVIYCANSNNRYKTYFEEQTSQKWYGVSMERMVPPTLPERNEIRARALKANGEPSFFKKLFGSVSSAKSNGGKTNVSGVFYIGSHQCPYCGNRNFVKCHKCKEWTCNPSGAKEFRCAICGNSGTITGKIDAASGNLSNGTGNKKKF